MRLAGDLLLRLLPAGVLLVLLLSMIQSPLRLSPDCGIYLESGQLLLAGKRPYVDFIEINPPMIIYLNALPALVARVAGIHAVAAFNAVVFAVLLWSTLAIRRQLAAADLDPFRIAPDLVAAAWAGFSLWLWLGTPLPTNDFAQREHLFALLWMPYGLLRSRRVAAARISPAGAAALGAVAALGCCLKPFFLVTAVIAELALLLTRRSLRSLWTPEVIAFAAVCALYVLHFALLPRDIREAFFGIWVPLLARHYGAYKMKSAGDVVPLLVAAAGAGALALLAAQWKGLRASASGGIYACLGAFAIAAVGAYYWQAKGFFYHQIPALAAATVLVSIAATQIVTYPVRGAALRWSPLAKLATALIGAWIVWSNAPVALAMTDNGNRYLPGFEKLVATHAPAGEPIAIFSTSAYPEYPTLAQLERHQAVRFASLVYLSVAMSARPHDGGENEARILDMLAEDLRNNAPPVIVIDDRRCGRCTGHKLATHLAAHPGIGAVLQGYRRVRASGLPGTYAVFVKN